MTLPNLPEIPSFRLNTFKCPNFMCPDCGYSGVVECQTPALTRTEREQTTFTLGDKVSAEMVGTKEIFDGVMCPLCLKRGKLKIHGVTLTLRNGVFMSASFDYLRIKP